MRSVSNLAAQVQSLQDLFRTLPAWVGNESVNFYVDSFRRQGYIDNKVSKWAKRKKNHSPSNKEKYLGSRAVLVKSGSLRRSIRYQVSGNKIRVFTDVPYAQVHNEGLQVTGTQSVSSFSRKGKNGKPQTVKAHTRRINHKMPQRQFMDIPGKPISAFLEKRIIMHIERALDKLL